MILHGAAVVTQSGRLLAVAVARKSAGEARFNQDVGKSGGCDFLTNDFMYTNLSKMFLDWQQYKINNHSII
jgi:hypothetical protein